MRQACAWLALAWQACAWLALLAWLALMAWLARMGRCEAGVCVAGVGVAGVVVEGVDVAGVCVAGGRAMAIRGRRGRRGNDMRGLFVGVGWLGRARAESAQNAVRV